jgi:uncharacterized membrane protein YgcG
MKRLPQLAIGMLMAVAALVCVAVCRHASIPAVSAAAVAQDPGAQYPPLDQGPDPAAANEAPGDTGMAPSGQSYTTEAPPQPGQNYDDSQYAEQPTANAPQPPPPLPDYDQPPPPADGYIWMPGYWAWGPNGYYWVPGSWVEPPYVGALWTPGYWGFYGSRYMFYPGHWGIHIGFYGGINYGFGYFGFGYEGGYWNAGRFFYNRAYNRIDERVVHNVYSYHVDNRVVNNHYVNNNRPSFRGGAGVQVRPQPQETRAWQNEPTAPRMNSQKQHANDYGSVREQYANQNHGQPPSPAIRGPLPADRNVRPQVRGGSGRGGNQPRGGSGGGNQHGGNSGGGRHH